MLASIRYRVLVSHSILAILGLLFLRSASAEGPIADGAELELVSTGHIFTEGPARDSHGDLFFTDVVKAEIWKMKMGGTASKWMDKDGGCNGLYFTSDDRLIACQMSKRKLVEIDAERNVTVLAESYDGKKLNSPNDLWIDAKGGIYFTDPAYRTRNVMEQDGEYVYYLAPDRESLVRVEDTLVRPNGLVGSADGKALYVADAGADKTYRYNIAEDGSLSGKTLFTEMGSDGMTLDEQGNVYLTHEDVHVFNPAGEKILTIDMEVHPTNVRFAGPDRRTLFITARPRVYALQMSVAGL